MINHPSSKGLNRFKSPSVQSKGRGVDQMRARILYLQQQLNQPDARDPEFQLLSNAEIESEIRALTVAADRLEEEITIDAEPIRGEVTIGDLTPGEAEGVRKSRGY